MLENDTVDFSEYISLYAWPHTEVVFLIYQGRYRLLLRGKRGEVPEHVCRKIKRTLRRPAVPL